MAGWLQSPALLAKWLTRSRRLHCLF